MWVEYEKKVLKCKDLDKWYVKYFDKMIISLGFSQAWKVLEYVRLSWKVIEN